MVGCGNSGAEIALDLALANIDVSMVVRNPTHVVPRQLLGRGSQESAIMLARLPIKLRDSIIGAVMRVAVGNLSAWGIERPSIGINRMIEDFGRIPMLDLGTIAKIKEGKIAVVPGIQEVFSHGVQFTNGTTQPFEAIIFATGYRPGLNQIIKDFASISDPRGRPRHFAEQTDIDNLFFIGFKNPTTGALREIALEAPRIAKAIKLAI